MKDPTIAVYTVTWSDGSVGRLETKSGYVRYAEGRCRAYMFNSIDAVRASLLAVGASIERHDDQLVKACARSKASA